MMDTQKCKECDKRGAPVEGMTGQCHICGEIFCFGHLGNHEHTMSEIRTHTELRVIGVGRVGSYASAKKSGRCRNRKYWAIAYFDDRKVYESFNSIGYPYGNRECSDSPHFKTKTEAENYLSGR